MSVLPGPVLLADPLPAGWRRCSSLGCGAPTGHAGARLPEAVPPRPVAPAGRWMHRCRGNARCGLPEGHEGVHASVPEAPCTCEPDMQCYPCSGLVWQAAAVAVAGPEVDVGAELSATVSAAAPGLSATLAAVAAAVDRASRSLDAVPMPCAETMLAIDALESAETLVADLRAAPRSCTCSGDPDPACATCDVAEAILYTPRELALALPALGSVVVERVS